MQVISSIVLNKDELKELFSIAHDAIEKCFSDEELQLPDLNKYQASIAKPGAAFVTLKVKGELQGCIGSVVPQIPLGHEVYQKALASAFQDHRFEPLNEEQLDDLTIEVSVLSKPEKLAVNSEQELIDYLSENKVGVILSYLEYRALYLPQVWNQLPDPADFIQHLKNKAGMPIDFWHKDLVVETFVVDAIEDEFKK